MTVSETALALGISRQRVQQLIYTGVLPARRHGNSWYIEADDVEMLAHQRRGATCFACGCAIEGETFRNKRGDYCSRPCACAPDADCKGYIELADVTVLQERRKV